MQNQEGFYITAYRPLTTVSCAQVPAVGDADTDLGAT